MADSKILRFLKPPILKVGHKLAHTVQIFQDISDLLLSHFSSWFSLNITWTYINDKKTLDFTGNFWENSKIAHKDFFLWILLINIEKWIDLKNDRCKYVRILQYLRK